MSGFIVVGTDTDAGKTAFATLFLSAFPTEFAYWKPAETGESDTERVRRLVPDVRIFEPLARFRTAVAPMLAARIENRPMPGVSDILDARPHSERPLLIETFGGPLSPLTDDHLQIDLIREFRLPVVLVVSTAVGAVGRTLSAIESLARGAVQPLAIVMLGPPDAFAAEQVRRHAPSAVLAQVTLPPGEWTAATIRESAEQWRTELQTVANAVRDWQQPASAATKTVSRDAEVVWHPYTPLVTSDAPLPVIAAENEFLILADGRRLIDGISSWWTILHGHREPTIMAAIREATHTLDHVLFAGATHPHAVELAASLLERIPGFEGGRVFYSDNGSTAVEVALKMAYQYWCHRDEPFRTLFIGFENGYHGDTFGAMSVGRDPLFFGRFEPLLFRSLQVPVSAAALDTVLTKHTGEVAAVLIEPLVQGAGGMQMHTPGELRELFQVARAHGVLMIADEVMTGFGRTGSFFAFEQAGILPDLVCVAKGITGGVLPLAATIASPDVVSAFATADRTRTFFHGHSFTANPIACAAAVANFHLMRRVKWQADVQRIAAFWESSLRDLAAHPMVKAVRIRGLIAAVELDIPGGYLATVGRDLRLASLQRGVMLRPLGNVLYAMPPLCTSNTSLGRIAEAIHGAIGALSR